MMWALFKKQKEIRSNSKYYLFVQDKWAKKMSTLTSDLSKQSLVFYLILFVVIAGSMSIYNVYKGFLLEDYKTGRIEIISNSTPINVNSAFDKPTNSVLSKTIENENITRFRVYLDSLKKFKEGKKAYDSIKYYRPALLDSLVFIENFNKTNFKK